MQTYWSYPFGRAERLTLHPRYAYLRQQEPLARVRMPVGDWAWLVTTYYDARTVLLDRRFSRQPGHDEPRVQETILESPDSIMMLDPPDHTGLRIVLAKAFNARRIGELRAGTEAKAAELCAALAAEPGPVDLMQAFVVPLVLTAVAQLLGIPARDQRRVVRWLDSRTSTTQLTEERRRSYHRRIYVYLNMLIRERDKRPTHDLIGVLVRAGHDGEYLAEDEVMARAHGLLRLAFETICAQLASFVYTLHTHDGAWAQVCARPETVPTAVEELLRYVPIAAFAGFARYAEEDVELEGGLVRADEAVLVALPAANRDERIFTDPERLDLTRDPNPHLGFGHGIHHCLGALLARMTLQVGIGALTRDHAELRLATTDVPWRVDEFVRRPVALPVTV
jgi:cytochrome P450